MTQSKNSAAINKNKVIELLKIIASLKLTVICLVLFAFLVVWGTLYQADHGLYQAQQKFFFSWVFLLFGFIPFPGTVLVMFVMFFNLLGSLFFRIRFKLSNIGNIITHTGIMVLLLGGFFTFYFSVESTLMLKEGETGSMSSSGSSWELAVWEQGGTDLYAVDTGGLDSGDAIDLAELGLALQVDRYYENCAIHTGNLNETGNVINSSGIRAIEAKSRALEAGENIPGMVFQPPSAAAGPAVLLYGGDSMPTPAAVNNRTFYFSLRRKRFPLPLTMTLLDFKVKHYPNSNIPKSYESRVRIKAVGGVDREVVISMNKPLRFEDLTFFQSSYRIARDGTEYTHLAVVKNSGRLLPYISSIWIFIGLILHFLVKLRKRRG